MVSDTIPFPAGIAAARRTRPGLGAACSRSNVAELSLCPTGAGNVAGGKEGHSMSKKRHPQRRRRRLCRNRQWLFRVIVLLGQAIWYIVRLWSIDRD